MARPKLRGALVGCGDVANSSHLPAWRARKDVQIVAFCDRNLEAARAAARRFGVSAAYDDMSPMLRSEQLDFVDICSPPLTHFELSMEAIEAGLHALVEKQMAIGLRDAEELVLAARQGGVKLCVVHNFLFTPVLRRAKSLVERGAIGEVLGVEVDVSARRTGVAAAKSHWCHDLPGGMFGEYTPHAVYLASAFLGKINSVKTVSWKHGDFAWLAADELTVLLECERGLGNLNISCNSRAPMFTLKIRGTDGILQIDNFALSMVRIRNRGIRAHQIALGQLDIGLQVLGCLAAGVLRALRGRRWYNVGHEAIIEQFIRSIRDGSDPPVSGEDGRETIRVLDEVWEQTGWDTQPDSKAGAVGQP